ncbi:putative multidrug resistance ABC transporter ATP-binding/permease protein YheH [Planococcus massiliensis]|uniref:Putative multidrug resistance ABC transporter ATP-binding/permease protein YheH n=1 Tax=Planococcus massiliensis TaxID=1499687 RepID=A0A098ENY2_9BACL|nr:ABC transporter ATP-binding protein [Planococcus massiliensis]CEG23507.1 putative multidrug resistance ABC transporter ATP-binding/permease protein YheH [Planococcus massiliensis]
MGTGKRLIKYAMQFKKILLGGLMLLAVAVAADLAAPLIAKEIIDNHIAPANGTVNFEPIAYLLAIFLGLGVVASIFRYLEYIFLQKGANSIIKKMRNDVFEHVQTLPIRYFDSLPAGKVVSRITNDTEAIRELFVTVLSQFATSFMYMAGIYAALFYLDWQLASMMLVLIPLLYGWMLVYRKFAAKYNHVVREKLSDMNAIINESIQGMTIIQAFRREKLMKNEFEELNDKHYKFQQKLLILEATASHNMVGVLRSLIFILFIWYFGTASMSVNSAVTVGVLYAFVDYIIRLFNPISGIVNQFAKLEQALVAAERVFRLLDRTGEPVSDEKIARYRGNVRFENVWFAYEEDEYVLKDISFEAKQGETVALVGHTGSGKSSIMNLLFRFYDVTEGAIKIDGMNINDMTRQAVREHMGIVLQDPYLFTGTIESNITLGDSRISRQRVEEALAAVGGERVLKHLPKGIDEPVVEKGSTLSSGQRQLVSFARALAFDPAILILDEATSNIDTETEEIIQHAMEVLKKGRTTFIIAHRLSTIKNADRILVLDHGRIAEAGSHDELMKLGGQYYQMYQIQSGMSPTQIVG